MTLSGLIKACQLICHVLALTLVLTLILALNPNSNLTLERGRSTGLSMEWTWTFHQLQLHLPWASTSHSLHTKQALLVWFAMSPIIPGVLSFIGFQWSTYIVGINIFVTFVGMFCIPELSLHINCDDDIREMALKKNSTFWLVSRTKY